MLRRLVAALALILLAGRSEAAETRWDAPERVGEGLAGVPSAVAWEWGRSLVRDRVSVFARRAGGELAALSFGEGAEPGWRTIARGVASDPSCAVDAHAALTCYVRHADGRLLMLVEEVEDGWVSRWPLAAPDRGEPVAAGSGHVFLKGVEGLRERELTFLELDGYAGLKALALRAMRERRQAYGIWHAFGGGAVDELGCAHAHPTVACVAVGPGGALRFWSRPLFRHAGAWSGLDGPPGGAPRAVALVAVNAALLELFVVDRGGTLWQRSRGAGEWLRWRKLATGARAPSCLARSRGRLDCFWGDGSGGLWRMAGRVDPGESQ